MKDRWDQFCFLRANNPSKYGWALLVGLLVIVLILAICGMQLLPLLALL